jgi:hypothetical protein
VFFSLRIDIYRGVAQKMMEKLTPAYYIKRKDFTPLFILPLIGVGLIFGIGWFTNQPIKSTETSLALGTKLNDVMSRIEVGINKQDYIREMQDLNIKVNNFKRDKNSLKVRNGANLLAVTKQLFEASDAKNELTDQWEPNTKWSIARKAYLTLENCNQNNQECFTLKQETELAILEANKLLESLGMNKIEDSQKNQKP